MMYPALWQALKANVYVLVLISGFFAILQMDRQDGVLSPALFSVFVYWFAYAAHRSVLLGESYHTVDSITALFRQGPKWSYTWRYFTALAVLLNLVLLAATFANAVLGPGTYSHFEAVLKWTFLALGFLLIVPFFALFGTALPAAATGGDAGIAISFWRGRKTFWKTYLRFCLGPVVLAAMVMKLGSLEIGFSSVPSFLSILNDLVLTFVVSLLSFVNVVFFGVVLGLAYQESEGN